MPLQTIGVRWPQRVAYQASHGLCQRRDPGSPPELVKEVKRDVATSWISLYAIHSLKGSMPFTIHRSIIRISRHSEMNAAVNPV